MIIVPKLEIPPLGMLPICVSAGTLNTCWFRHTDTTQNEEHVEFVILESFKDLVRLQVFVLNTGLILPQPVDSDPTLSLGKTASSNRRIGEEDKHDDTPACTESTTKEKNK
jgi:hypothetical protein